jgi:predicted MFS family arabinose efflux permease
MALSPGSVTAELSESDWHYYGWRVALAANLGVMAGFGSLFVYTFSVFLKPLSAQFGWSREAVSGGFGLGAISVGICSPFIGRLLDRFTPRRIILPCMTVFGAGFASLAFLRPHLWQFYGTCILIGVVGNGAAHLAYSRAIVTWFRARLGAALAVVMAGSAIGSMVLPLLAQTIVDGWGWRSAYLCLGILALALGLPLTWRYVRDRQNSQKNSDRPNLKGVSWQQGLRSLPFWIIIAALLLNACSSNGVLAHLSALLTDRGLTAEHAALALSVFGAASLGGRVLVGKLLDRFMAPRVAFATLMPAALGTLILSHAGTLAIACVATALIGIGGAAEADITPYLLTRYFGLRSFSTLYGLTWTFYALAAALGPIVLGRAFDLTGSYTSTVSVFAFAVALAASLMLLLPRYGDSAPAVSPSSAGSPLTAARQQPHSIRDGGA